MTLYQLGNGKKFYTLTFGCQMNEHDSEVLAGMLDQMGFEKAASEEEADLLIINTCAVREKAEQKVLGKIGTLRYLKENKPDMKIAIGGCMVQQEHVANKIYRDFTHVDIIFGTHNINRFPQLLEHVMQKGKRVKEISQDDSQVFENLPHKREDSIKAWVVISYGCDNYCKYCIVPYVRGQQRSRDPEHIKYEVEKLAKEGLKEITLLGQNVNSYGKDLDQNISFTNLLEELSKIEGIERIRFMTSHPKDFDKELITTLKESNKICEHFHLPVQAGSNKILKKMGRGYTREHYVDIVNDIRAELPNASITTDIIVGYPGEEEEDFQETLDLVQNVKFDSAFTFVYSKRSGTPAAEMAEQVDEQTKKGRIQKLISVQQEISEQRNKDLENTVQRILVEGVSKNNEDMLSGRTRTDKLVHFPGDKELIGELVDVKITRGHSWNLYGEIFEDSLT
ncbi:tRNA (N6-isopentenyl adenosine(37)-C2)-methylthiotransferase MiaB [Natranaerobius thermophilus]|uniref:tRNA-2-methylthio-N(6)-dimethylallyladenosine synthase n=1 Tax=Natranaerobius thermophilus (strain ATCC BAA-1301 / DSM 18059 / JW/NM-WN-LF) TaxID=457570 RepID=MIAB_NATTJ|nr:tRNA (N6-isopentenyl adenosine(37)-C2)-methylthiotransferase MiaB [Natranaerobius thermophilus]B2A3X6.1 RecName: Full=tRNA-2-methylthio-N(6)-dimethylallyladenosine synthase; AltName: Full=(Dimethylallyl)adenosine tRNA methylthiotransferase MiaB; AltName: Full=tRNA-i(6)A37 methylthiotransferase [Natranaerobius thermophilus JW/NM-WN-LF]ACB85078.1 tRNA-i(6)A37 thiotransferase enzyme MiaB [Natranaerobius thermophilus JW/NM-WN-LF]